MKKRAIYFDNAATTGHKPSQMIDAVVECLRNTAANPGRSGHALALKAAEIIYDTREALGRFFNFPRTENIILTKNATESLNIAILGRLSKGGHAVTTSMEHNSVLRPLNLLRQRGIIDLSVVKAREDGVVAPADLLGAMHDDTTLVAVTSASNVTGTIIDLKNIYAVTSAAGVPLLVDGAQGAGSMEIDLQETPFDLFAVTGHKHLYGPQGTGALFVKNPDVLDFVFCGGTGSLSEKTVQPDFSPDKFEAGTPNTPGFAGLTAALKALDSTGLRTKIDRERHLIQCLIDQLRQLDEVQLYAPDVPRVATISFNINGAAPSDVASYLDQTWSICCRPGLHCAPEAHRTMGTFPEGTVRFSLSAFNTEEEIDVSIRALKEFIHR